MPRRRIIDPQFWNDALIGRLPVHVRLFYIGLWNFSDDAGLVTNDPPWLRVSIFPHDPRVKPSTIVGYLEMLETSGSPGRILRYAVGPHEYFLVTRFHDHQSIERPTGSRLPRPPQALLDAVSEKAKRAVMARTTVVSKAAVPGRAQNGAEITATSPSPHRLLGETAGKAHPQGKGSEGNRNERARARIDEEPDHEDAARSGSQVRDGVPRAIGFAAARVEADLTRRARTR